jgi:hypothetical protein
MAAYDKKEKCMICGDNHVFSEGAVGVQCMFCGDSFYANLVCENGHYVCEECHTQRAYEMITSICRKTKKKEAINIAYELMTNKWVKMHGAEHPYLVVAVLLAAYKNRGYGAMTANWSFTANLAEAKNRVMKIPPGPCGYWGCCGEAIAAGIFASLVLKTAPMSVGERGTANSITAKVLEQISVYGGPRCSKRDAFIALLTTSEFTKEYWHMPLTDFESVECLFYGRNPDCIKGRCPFYPGKG